MAPIEVHDFSGHISSSEMVILLRLGGLPFHEDIGYCKNELTFVYYAHIGILELKTSSEEIVWVLFCQKKRYLILNSDGKFNMKTLIFFMHMVTGEGPPNRCYFFDTIKSRRKESINYLIRPRL